MFFITKVLISLSTTSFNFSIRKSLASAKNLAEAVEIQIVLLSND